MGNRMAAQPLLCSSLFQEHPVTPGLAKLPVANAVAEQGVPGGICARRARLGHTCGHQGLAGAWVQVSASLCHTAGSGVGFYSLGKCLLLISRHCGVPSGSEVRRKLHPVPLWVIVIKRGKKGWPHSACTPLEGGCSFSSPPWRG